MRAASEGFERAAAALARAMTTASPQRVTIEVVDAQPQELGWSADAGTPAKTLTVWTPSGHARAFGLLPREPGTYAPLPWLAPRLVAVTDALLVVDAPQPRVAMTQEAMLASQPLLDAATRPIDRFTEGAGLEGGGLRVELVAPLRGEHAPTIHVRRAPNSPP